MDHRIEHRSPERAELLALYDSVGWSTYVDQPEVLTAAVDASHAVLCARSLADDELVGLARTISDGHTIVYLQDILVRPDRHRAGIGGSLLDAVLDHYSHVRQFVLLTDAEDGQRRFYESRGLTEVHDVNPHPLRSFVRL